MENNEEMRAFEPTECEEQPVEETASENENVCKLKHAVSEIGDKLSSLNETLAPYIEKCKKNSEETAATVEEKIKEHPVASVCAAFGVGLVIAALLRGRHND